MQEYQSRARKSGGDMLTWVALSSTNDKGFI